MARATAREEVETQLNRFFEEATTNLLDDIKGTRQMGRRQEMLNQLDALELVRTRFYSWLNSPSGDK